MKENMPQNHLSIHICEDAKDAIKRGHIYREPVYNEAMIEKIVVVKNGTEAGKSTVDITMIDKDGKRYVAMITGALLRSIPTEFE
jgi:hypothetical protein